MELIHSQDGAALEKAKEAQAKADAKDIIGIRLRELFANMLRMSRRPFSGGRPHELSHQMVAFLEAVQAHDALPGGALLAGNLWPMISLAIRDRCPHLSEEQRKRPMSNFEAAEEWIIEGAAQIIASRMVWQPAQTHRGEHDLMHGVERLEEIRARNRKLSQGDKHND